MFIPVSDNSRFNKTPFITIGLIAINAVLFLWFSFGSNLNFEISKYGMIPWELSHFENISQPVAYMVESTGYSSERTPVFRTVNPLLTIFSSIFIHASFMHIAWNMLFLWVFGRSVENKLGRLAYALFYISGGVCAAIVHSVFNLNSMVPVVGASGAVSAVMGGYLVSFPVAKIRTLVFILFFITFVEIPAAVFLLIWFAFQFVADPQVAWLAHVGGFIIGILIIKKINEKEFKEGEENDQNFN